MTDEQIENCRKILCLQLGPYALIMSKEQIIKIRDNMQNAANTLSSNIEQVNSFFTINKYTNEFNVTEDPIKDAFCNCCKSTDSVFECTDTNNKVFMLCNNCVSLIEEE